MLHIPKPCTEDWTKMTPTTKGAFCQSCQKEVIDFTIMSDDEVKYFLLKNAGTTICGRASSNQLKQYNITISNKVFVGNTATWKKYLAILIICFGSLIGCTNGKNGAALNSISLNVKVAGTFDKHHLQDSTKPLQKKTATVGVLLIEHIPEIITVTETITQGGMYIEPREVIEQQIIVEPVKEDVLPKKDTFNLPKKAIDSCSIITYS